MAVRYEEQALKLKGVSNEDSKRLQEQLAAFRQHQTRS